MIDREMGLTVNLEFPPKAAPLDGAFNEKPNLLQKSLAELDPGEASSVSISKCEDSGLPNVVGPSQEEAPLAEIVSLPLMDSSISSGPKGNSQAKNKGTSCGPKGKSQAKNKGTWSRLVRKPTTPPSDANMSDLCVLNKKRPAIIETEPMTKKRRPSPSHGKTPVVSSSVVAAGQPRRSP